MKLLSDLVSAQDGTISLSKFVMLTGVLVSTGLIIADTIYNKRLDTGLFTIYTGITVGANTVNKAISVNKDIKTAHKE